jgi:hypothetical protein
MKVVIQVSAEDRARVWGVLVRHSPGTALPNGVFLISEDAARALRRARVNFTEVSREAVGFAPGGVLAGERI